MPRVDLNELRAKREAQRVDARAENIELVVGEDTFVLPPVGEWPIEFMDVINESGPAAGLRMLLGEDQWARLRPHGLTNNDLNDLMTAAGDEGGVSLPESPASGASSTPTPKTSKPTS